jgi:hypothetical protein
LEYNPAKAIELSKQIHTGADPKIQTIAAEIKKR